MQIKHKLNKNKRSVFSECVCVFLKSLDRFLLVKLIRLTKARANRLAAQSALFTIFNSTIDTLEGRS